MNSRLPLLIYGSRSYARTVQDLALHLGWSVAGYIDDQSAAGSVIKGAKVNVLGLTFKENCGDLRNSKVIDIIRELQSYGVEVFVTDPQADAEEAMHEYGVTLTPFKGLPRADAIVAAVAHKEYIALSVDDFARKLVKGGAFIDVKACFSLAALREAGLRVWRL